MRRIIAAIITLALVVGICPMANVEASAKSDAYEAYYNWIEKKGSDFTGFKLANIDNDGIPELISMRGDDNSKVFAVCTFDGDKVNEASFSYSIGNAALYLNAVYFPKKGKIISVKGYSNNGEETIDFYTVKNGKIKKKHTAEQAKYAESHTFDGKKISQDQYTKKTDLSKATWLDDLKYISKKKMQKKLNK